MIVKLVIYLLKRTKINAQDRARLTNAILEKIGAIPSFDIIFENEKGQLIINNRILDREAEARVRESAKAAVKNRALNLIISQVTYKAITNGVHRAETPEQILFGKAAIWQGQQVINTLSAIARVPAGEFDSDDE